MEAYIEGCVEACRIDIRGVVYTCRHNWPEARPMPVAIDRHLTEAAAINDFKLRIEHALELGITAPTPRAWVEAWEPEWSSESADWMREVIELKVHAATLCHVPMLLFDT